MLAAAWCLVAVRRPASLLAFRSLASGLGPVTVVGVAVLVLRYATGAGFDYGLAFDPVRTGYLLVSAPLRALHPGGAVPLFRSPFGLCLALGIVLTLAAAVYRKPEARAMLAAFFVCQLPFAIAAAAESRYFYGSHPFLLGAVVAGGVAWVPARFGSVGLVLLLTLAGVEAVRRDTMWVSAYRHATQVREQVDRVLLERQGEPTARVVVVNLPDRDGPADMMWRPYMWRNGLSAFAGPFVRVSTPDSTVGWEDSGIPVVARDRIGAEFAPPDRVVEVVARPGGGYEVVPYRP